MNGFKIKSDFADAVEIRELKDSVYYMRFYNLHSKKGYVIMVTKNLFDDVFENRTFMEATIKTLKEAKKEKRDKLQDVM